MSVHRRFLVTAALVFCAAPLFALNPSARTESRMVFNPATHRIVLFGGVSAVDRGTKTTYDLGDTWERAGQRWIQLFPAHNPQKRAAHVMVYDSNRNRVIMFSGRSGNTALNDTWVWENDDWRRLDTPNSPTPRFLAGGAFDSIRDRLVVFGGSVFSADGKTLEAAYDTWEFDGTTWTRKAADGPKVTKPILTYDAARNQVLMLALGEKGETVMYSYEPATSTWKQLTPKTLPDCVNEGAMVYNSTWGNVFYTGGICAGSSLIEESMEWDGTNWNSVETLTGAGRVFGAALAYDADRDQMVYFGGTTISGYVRANTLVVVNTVWIDVSTSAIDPTPRSLFTFVTDPVNNAIWLFGGIDDLNTFGDFWKYQNGHWQEIITGGEPAGCIYPAAAWDTDRNKMVLICNDSTTYEFDGAAWKTMSGLKEVPAPRRQGSMVYDQTLKKTVLFGGWQDNYLDQTWTWDGTAWTRVKKNLPPPRALAAMWYDPNLKKTVLYGGLGRQTSDGRLVRFDDMWTFDGNGWIQLKPAGGTPGMRYGAQVAVDPRTNRVVLFGGLRVDVDSSGKQTQVYADDTWEWDGTSWKKLAPPVAPPARENGGFTFDPSRNELVMFAGYAGSYQTDIWTYTNGVWRPRVENVTQRKRPSR